jgi:hypothetical protein
VTNVTKPGPICKGVNYLEGDAWANARSYSSVCVSCCKATKPRWPLTRSTSGLSPIRSDAAPRMLSLSPAFQRLVMIRLPPPT